MTTDPPPCGENPQSDVGDISEQPHPAGESPDSDAGDIVGRASDGDDGLSVPKVKGLGRMASVMARILSEEGEVSVCVVGRINLQYT